MNIIIYTLIILGLLLYFLLMINSGEVFSSKKISKNCKDLVTILIFGSIALAIIFAFGGKIYTKPYH